MSQGEETYNNLQMEEKKKLDDLLSSGRSVWVTPEGKVYGAKIGVELVSLPILSQEEEE